MGVEAAVVWESVKFDGSAHKSVAVRDLGTTEEGRWLFLPAGATVTRQGDGSFAHPCDAVVLIPTQGMWTAMWLTDWDPVLYVDVARLVHVEPERIVTMDLDVDVVRRPGGSVEVLDLDEFDVHRVRYGYPDDVVRAVRETTDWLVVEIAEQRAPFGRSPARPSVS